ncbi:MAG: hypothetical protein ACRC1O_05055 [Ralstonia mannitolilytica]|uniref:Uncharacterized protein n=1 Tax=Ralstonia pickettii (strain 12D) TaxID=428406 RepID=C6BC90_RALP1|nr:hypothetical protein [Ralstonia mannitolilytica]
MSKNTTAVARGALPAKLKLELPKTTPLIRVSDMEKGNRAMRRAAKKQNQRSSK